MISKQLALEFFPSYAKLALESSQISKQSALGSFSLLLVLESFQTLLAFGFSRPLVLESSQLWLVLVSFLVLGISMLLALVSSPFSRPLVLESSQTLLAF